MVDALQNRLREERDEVAWSDLRQHADRGAMLVVSGELGLLEATSAVVRDERPEVERWLQTGTLARPTDAQRARWDDEPDTRFECLIAQPFVLAREL